jgi:hypothetical protein
MDYTADFKRLDRAIFRLEKSHDRNSVVALSDSFGSFFPIYTTDIMQMPPPENSMLPDFLNRFTGDPVWQKLQREIDLIFPDLSREEQKIETALKRYGALFGVDSLPGLVAYNSGYNVGIYPSPEWLGVGLEWYIGPDNAIVKRLPPDMFPLYKRQKMKPEYLSVNAVKGWLFVKYADSMGETLLDQMAFRGKMLFMTKVLTEEPVDRILNFSPEEIDWCEASEYSVWSFFLENDLLFDTDPKKINQMLNDGPFTPGMPAESPGGVGNWIGLRMVEEFMEANDEMNLAELPGIDEKEILRFYKPGR